MSRFFYEIWGTGNEMTTLQVSVRTVVMFFVALILLRAGGVRIFSRKSAFDEIIAIMLGAILSRGVVGASPFGSVVISGIILIAVYRLTGWLTTKSKSLERMAKGKATSLYKDGRFNFREMKKNMITEEDIKASLRLEAQQNNFEKVREVRFETNGRISFILDEEV
jgi:uncharacterized membrane protein YcaP (DUF421 family)